MKIFEVGGHVLARSTVNYTVGYVLDNVCVNTITPLLTVVISYLV